MTLLATHALHSRCQQLCQPLCRAAQWTAVGILALAATTACGGENVIVVGGALSEESSSAVDGNGDNGDRGATTGTSGDNSETSGQDALYVVATSIVSPTGTQRLLIAVDSLTEDISYEAGDEAFVLPGRSTGVFGMPGKPYVFVSERDVGIHRYLVTPEGEFQKSGPSLTFAQLGLLAETRDISNFPFSAWDKAYTISPPASDVIQWDPSEMAITSSFSVLANGEKSDGQEIWNTQENDGSLSGLVLRIPRNMAIDKNRAIIGVARIDASDKEEDLTMVLERTIRIDISEDETEDDWESFDEGGQLRLCGEWNRVRSASDGTFYFSNSVMDNVVYTASEGTVLAGYPCLRRVLAGETQFDRDFVEDIRDLVDGRPAGNFTLLDDETAVIWAYHSEFNPNDGAKRISATELKNGQFYFRYLWKIGEPEAEFVAGQEASFGPVLATTGDEVFVTSQTPDGIWTEFKQLMDDGKLGPGFRVQGNARDVARLDVHAINVVKVY